MCRMWQSAANAMKHSVQTQGSNVYDAKTHDRLNAAAFGWCAQFASRYEAGEVSEEQEAEADAAAGAMDMPLDDDEGAD